MSTRNGDKSRTHRLRKQKIERRERNRKLLAQAGKSSTAAKTGDRSGS